MTEEIELAVKRGALVLKEGADFSRLMEVLLADREPESAEERPFPPVGKHVEITQKVRDALRKMPAVWASVEPKSRRALSPAESAKMAEEREVLKVVEAAVKARLEAINTGVHHHMDVLAEKEGRADPVSTPRSTKGNYALARKGAPEQRPIEGRNQSWSREYRSNGGTLDTEELLRMYEAGEIDREDYLAFTRSARVIDEDRILKAVVADPTRLKILYALGRAKDPIIQLYVR